MHVLNIQYLPFAKTPTLPALEAAMRQLPLHSLQQVNWAEYPYQPGVSFSIAHGNNEIFLHFQVSEKQLRAACLAPNDPVYEDSCVEFFIWSEADGGYTNFEWNSMGVCLAAFGPNRQSRLLLSPEQIKKIRYKTRVQTGSDEEAQWEIWMIIPQELFTKSQEPFWQIKGWKANFYKCGDQLTEPHFISWAAIDAPAPDFHLPAFFGGLSFEPVES